MDKTEDGQDSGFGSSANLLSEHQKEQDYKRGDDQYKYSSYYTCPCYYVQVVIRAFLKCFGVVEPTSNEEQKKNETRDHEVVVLDDVVASTSEPETTTLEDGVSQTRALTLTFRRVPPRPPIGSGGGTQHN